MPLEAGKVYLGLTTPLGPEKLQLQRIDGEERLSGLYEFHLEAISEDPAVDLTKVVGKPASVVLEVPDSDPRYIHGLVTRFVQGGSDQRFTTYYADLRPWLWMLRLTADCRIFQEKTVPEIIKQVFQDNSFPDFRDALTGTYAPREYCVQYRETAFDFVTRLMQEEGIFYFFEHAEDKHTLVLGDDADAHPACPGDATALYRPNLDDAWQKGDVITALSVSREVRSGKYMHDDYNFETPALELKTEADGQGALRVYDYPGNFVKKDLGEAIAKLRMESLEWPEERISGAGVCRGFVAGHTFELKEFTRDDANKKYVLRWISHTASLERYQNSFEAFPAAVPFRPPAERRKPGIAGAQTAVVVGKSGEEIWTDKYGRVKVQFHWDQLGAKDEKSSCWVRVAQGWAGKGWGSWFLPRLGQEVVVSFLEGDPDRPLVTGSVYNGDQTVPYPLPDDQTKSTVKSRSSKGGGGFNEIRFEDKKDAEEIFVYAQKDQNITVKHDRTKSVFHDEKITVKNSRTATIQEADESLTVEKGNRTVLVKTGNETHEVAGTRALKVTKAETHTNEDNFTHEVTKNFVLKVKGDITIEATGAISIKSGKDFKSEAGMNMASKAKMELVNEAGTSLTNKAQMSLTNKAGMSLKNEAGVDLTNKAGAKMTNDGGAMLSSKASGMHQVEGGGMLMLKGGMVKVN